jgi:hypothetical protein
MMSLRRDLRTGREGDGEISVEVCGIGGPV